MFEKNYAKLKNNFSQYFHVFMDSKKYWLFFLIFISLATSSVISRKNIIHPKFEIMIFFIVAILGIFCILYYLQHNSEKEFFKVAFVVILCFGIICSFIVPISDVSDETEHMARAEITSQGVIFPHWTGEEQGIDRLFNFSDGEKSTIINPNVGFNSIMSINFFYDNLENTVFETEHDTDKINHSTIITSSAFEQNPFYGYLPQALGILVAKLFDLNVIWILWLGRIFNLICYASLISLSIKIIPKFKIQLLAVACIPITIYQAASISIDSMIMGLGLLTIAYFIYLIMLDSYYINVKHILIYTGLCLLLGLCKLPYLAFIFLILCIPKNKFKQDKTTFISVFICILLVAAIGLIWSSYSTPKLLHSWRSSYNYINSTLQMGTVNLLGLDFFF